MKISPKRYVEIHKYSLILGLGYYLAAVFVLKSMQFGVLAVVAVGFFNLFQKEFYQGRLKLAALNWLLPAALAILTANTLLVKNSPSGTLIHLGWILLLSLVPCFLLLTGKAQERPRKKKQLRIMNLRIVVQVTIFTAYAAISAHTWIVGGKAELLFWAIVNILTTAITPFLFGRVLCGWICPNATLQDALYKNFTFKRVFQRLPETVESQSRGTAMALNGVVDKSAPYLPFTLLLSWFLVFFLETVFNLTQEIWYPTCFAYGLFVVSLLFPWRKFCTYFCWFSSYRCLAGHNSLWRIRFDQSQCKKCKKCLAEEACPFYIDIRHQEREMPATCCLCFSCMDACPYPGVITMKKPNPVPGKSEGVPIPNH